MGPACLSTAGVWSESRPMAQGWSSCADCRQGSAGFRSIGIPVCMQAMHDAPYGTLPAKGGLPFCRAACVLPLYFCSLHRTHCARHTSPAAPCCALLSPAGHCCPLLPPDDCPLPPAPPRTSYVQPTSALRWLTSSARGYTYESLPKLDTILYGTRHVQQQEYREQ